VLFRDDASVVQVDKQREALEEERKQFTQAAIKLGKERAELEVSEEEWLAIRRGSREAD
jgi:hypothetical protein